MALEWPLGSEAPISPNRTASASRTVFVSLQLEDTTIGRSKRQSDRSSLPRSRFAHRELTQRLPSSASPSGDARPTHFVKSRARSKLLEWNTLQGIDAKKQEHANGGDIERYLGHALEELETGPFSATGNFTRNERMRHSNRKLSLRDSRLVAFFRSRKRRRARSAWDAVG